MSGAVQIVLTVNGERVSRAVDPRVHLVDFLRGELGLTGSHLGCEHGVCGACTVRVDGEIVRGCLVVAASLDGAEVTTIEGLTDSGEAADLQAAFVARNAAQCGFCTPGMVMSAVDLATHHKCDSEHAIREGLDGNLCRCTGYHNIVRAVRQGAQAMGA